MAIRIYTPENQPQEELTPEQAEMARIEASAAKLRKEAGLLPADLAQLQTHLDEELKKIGPGQSLPELENQAKNDADPTTHEFIQLADFVTKELEKKSTYDTSEQKVKVLKINRYRSVKDKEFETVHIQKGVQVNKAA